MMLETAVVAGESLLGRAKTSLRLRLAGHDRQTSVIAIERAKCLIGAAASCTLRLDDNRQEDRRLDPFHCLIVQGAAHTVVRRLSPAMRLNGCDFSDAVLNPGDRLAIGSYELEVLPPEGKSDSPNSAEVQGVRAEVNRLSRVLMAERAAWQARNDELTAELARAKAEAARRATEFDNDAARHIHTEQELSRLSADLERANTVLRDERARWQAERDDDQVRLEEAQQALQRQQATWEQTVARFEEERRAWHAERVLKTAELTNASKRVTQLDSELARSHDRAARLADEANAAALPLGAARETIKRLQKDLAFAQAQLDEGRRAHQAELRQKAVELAGALERTIRLEADLATANERVTRLSEDVETQSELYRRAQDTLEKSEDERAQDQATFDQERTAWQNERAGRAAELNEKSQELAAAAERLSRSEAELSHARDEIARLTEDVDSQVARYKRTQEHIERLEAEHAEAQEAFDRERIAWQSERDLRSSQTSEKLQELAAAAERLSRLEAELSQAQDEIARLTEDVTAQSALSSRAQEALQQSEEERACAETAFDQERTAWQTERDQRSEELNQKSLQLTFATERLSRLEAELSQANDQIARLTEEVNAGAAECNRANETLQRLEAERSEAQAAFDQERTAWQTQSDLRTAERNQKTLELAAATERLSRLDGELSQANQELARLTEEVRSQTALYNRTHEALQQLEEERAETQAAFDDERTSWRTEREERAEELSEKSLELAAAEERLHRLDAELSQANDKIARLTEDLDAQAAAHSRAEDALARSQQEHAEALAVIDQERTGSETDHNLHAEELREKSEQLAAATEKQSRLVAELSRLQDEHVEVQAAFEQARTEWQAEQSQHSLELAAAVELVTRLEAKLETAKSQIARPAEDTDNQADDEERQAALERLAAELEALRQTLDEEREAWFAQRNELQAGVAQAESRNAAFEGLLAELTDELETARRELADERAEWELRQLSEDAVGQPLAEVAAPVSDVAPTDLEPVGTEPVDSSPMDQEPLDGRPVSSGPMMKERVDNEPVESGHELNEPVEKQPTCTEDLFARFAAPETAEIAFQTPPSDAPVSSVDLLSRFGLSVHQETPEPAPLSPHRTEATTPQPAAEAGPAKPPHADGHHDEQDSIDAYMAQLMARLGKPGYVPPQEVAPQPTQVADTVPEPEVAAPETPTRNVPKLRDPSEMGRRAAPPELATDLSAMRELANLNARAAIDTHARSTLIKAWLSKALLMLLGMVTAGVETWFAMEGNEWAGYFIVPCLMIGIFWGWQYLVMSKRLHSSRDAVAEPSGDASPVQDASASETADQVVSG